MNEELYDNISGLTDQEICERIIRRELTQEAYLIACKILKERKVEIPITSNYAPSNSLKEETFSDFLEKYPHLRFFIWSLSMGLILWIANQITDLF